MPQKTSKLPNKPLTRFDNNPFFIATNGVSLFANLASSVALLMILLSVVNVTSSFIGDTNDTMSPDRFELLLSEWSNNDWVLAIVAFSIIGLAVVMVLALFGGISSYTSYRISQGKKVLFNEAFRASFDNLWSYLWLQIIIIVKTFLWGILFIIPGFIMWYRYSLASVAFFDDRKMLSGNSAVKESLRLTKNAWITTYSSKIILDVLTFGFLSSFISTAANASLYRILGLAGDGKKPEAHWLSWVVLVLPLLLVFTIFIVIVGFIGGVMLGTAQLQS